MKKEQKREGESKLALLMAAGTAGYLGLIIALI